MTIKVQLNDIRDPSTWSGKEPKNHSPSFDYCRKLISEGVDPNQPLEVYRGEKLAYTLTSIAWGATKKIRDDELVGPVVKDYKPMDEKAKQALALNRPNKLQRQPVEAFKS